MAKDLAIILNNGSLNSAVVTTLAAQRYRPVMVYATALPEEGAAMKLSVQDIIPLDKLRLNLASLVSIKVRLSGDSKAEALSELFHRKPGEAEVRLRLEKPRDFSVILDVTSRVRPDKEFKAEVERICGPESFEELARA